MKKLMIAAVLASVASSAQAGMNIRGAFNAWANQAMVSSYNNSYEATISTTAANTAIKFDRNGNWVENYGDNNTADDIANLSGANINIATAGVYKVTFFDTIDPNGNKRYSITPVVYGPQATATVWSMSVGIDGRSTVAGTEQNTVMSCVLGSQTSYTCTTNITVAANARVKFKNIGKVYSDQNNTTNFVDDLNLEEDVQGANPFIKLPLAGTYTVTFTGSSTNASRSYTITYLQAPVVNTATVWSMSVGVDGRSTVAGTEQNKVMACVNGSQSSYTCTTSITVAANARVKFKNTNKVYSDQNNATNFVDDLILEEDVQGANPFIKLPAAGTYLVTFIGSATSPNRTYKISKYETMNVRGSFNNWTNTQMNLVRPNVWSTSVPLSVSSQSPFKFDVSGNWVTNFGDNNADFVAEQSGNNIMLPAASTAGSPNGAMIRFNDVTRQYATCIPAPYGSNSSPLCQ